MVSSLKLRSILDFVSREPLCGAATSVSATDTRNFSQDTPSFDVVDRAWISTLNLFMGSAQLVVILGNDVARLSDCVLIQ